MVNIIKRILYITCLYIIIELLKTKFEITNIFIIITLYIIALFIVIKKIS